MLPFRSRTAFSRDTKNGIATGSIVLLMRGPILIGAVICSLIYPLILEYCSSKVLVHLGVAMIGIFYLFHDLWTLTERGLRFAANRLLDTLVVDDSLRAIYDPDTGLISCLVASFLGASSMYGLKMNSIQRTKLVQASLSLNNEEDAHKVLMEPGGCRILLPGKVQDWLNMREPRSAFQDDKQKHTGSLRLKSCQQPETETAGSGSSAVDHGSEMSSSDCDIADIHEQEEDDFSFNPLPLEDKIRDARGLCFGENDDLGRDTEYKRESHHTDRQQWQQSPQKTEADPMAVFLRIVKDLAMEQVTPYIEAMPESAIENVGMASIAALALQFLLRRNSKRAPWWGTLSALTFSSIATFSLGAIVSRQTFLGKIHDKETLQFACKEIASRVCEKLKRGVRTSKQKTALAMMVLLIIGRRKYVTSSSTRTMGSGRSR